MISREKMARRCSGLALAALLAMPAVSLWAQQPPYIRFEPATGPVYQYQARVRTPTETIVYFSNGPEPIVEIAMLPVEDHWIDVRACESNGGCGAWSLPHDLTADCDENGGVGLSDFPCRQGWMDWLMHYGQRTFWDERMELRRYADE